jgi:shikimate kinase
MNLFLIGYRCTGKTIIGKSIAATIDWSFVDSDTQVIKNCGKSIKDIVDTESWAAFRRMERSTIKQICTKDRQVVATGGGVVLDSDNVKAMKASGTIIWLCASARTIKRRMLNDENTLTLRPALTHKGLVEEIAEVLLERNSYYKSAGDFSIHTDGMKITEIAQAIIQRLKDSNRNNLF